MKSTVLNLPADKSRIPLCLDCNYQLTGLPTYRCPECGREFDPTNPVTINFGKPLGPMTRSLLRPTRWLNRFAPWIAGLGILAVIALALPDPLAFLLLTLLWLLCAVPYIFWNTIRFAVRIIAHQPKSYEFPDLLARRRIGNSILIAALLVITHIPGHCLIWLSRPALDHYGYHLYNEVPFLSPPPMPPKFCGVCYVWGTELGMRGVTAMIGLREVIYAPDMNIKDNDCWIWGPPKHLCGYWYTAYGPEDYW
jgi:hypothetical protein